MTPVPVLLCPGHGCGKRDFRLAVQQYGLVKVGIIGPHAARLIVECPACGYRMSFPLADGFSRMTGPTVTATDESFSP